METCGTGLILTNLLLAGLVLVPIVAIPACALLARLRRPRRRGVDMVRVPGVGTIPVLREEPELRERCRTA